MSDVQHTDRLGSALDQILELTILLNEDMERELAARGLTGARVRIVWLVQHNGPMTQRDLAEAMGVSARNVTSLVDGLVDSGFVTREDHPSDRRATLVTLTDHGTSTAEDLVREHQELARILFKDLSPRRFDELTKALEHILRALGEAIEAASDPSGDA